MAVASPDTHNGTDAGSNGNDRVSAGDFVIRSAQTGRYVQAGGLFSGYCLLASATSRQDATIFRAVCSGDNSGRGRGAAVTQTPPASAPSSAETPRSPPARDGPLDESEFATPVNADPGAGGGSTTVGKRRPEDKCTGDLVFKLQVVGSKKWVNMRADGYVDVVSTLNDQPGRPNGATFALEKLRQETFYEVELHEQQLGLLVSKDLPLRVVGFTPVKPIAGRGGNHAGEAERSGRVHVNDTIAFADNADLANLSRKEIIHIIMARRPITLGFKVADHTLLMSSRVTSPKPQSPVRSYKRSRSLQPRASAGRSINARRVSRLSSIPPQSTMEQEIDERSSCSMDLPSAQALFTAAELAQLHAVREQLRSSAASSYRQLKIYNDTNHSRCVSMISDLIRQQYSDVEPLFNQKSEAVVAVLFADE